MGYASIWKVLEDMLIELRKKDVIIPKTVMNDLKSAKVLIKIGEASEEDQGQTALKIEQYLGSVEAYLVTKAEKTFESVHIDKWLRCLEEARCNLCQTVGGQKEEAKFVMGVPRDQKWIRIEPLPSLPIKKLKYLAKRKRLSSRLEEDGRLLVWGKAEDLHEFVKRMTKQASK
jgi:hypothetical protein